jgi:phage shock protein A
MGIFSRLAQLIKANINDLIDKAEDPEKMLDQVIVDMNGQLIENRKRVAEAITDEKHLQRLVEKEAAEAADWERRAMLAVRQGDDGLARDALERKKHHAALAKQYEDQWQKQKAAVDQLKTALRMLNDKIEEAKRNKNLLKARIARAKAQTEIGTALHGLKDNSAFEQFERLKTKVERMEAEAEAGSELAEEYTGDRLAHRFKELEQAHVVDDDLLALKRQMGVAPAAPEPPPAAPPMRVKAPPAPPPVDAPPPSTEELERDELARALEEIQAEEMRERERLKR